MRLFEISIDDQVKKQKIELNHLDMIDVSKVQIAATKFLQNVSIYKGTRSRLPSIFELDSNKIERKSRNTTNEYTLLLDNLPIWSKFPKRTSAVVSTTSIYTAHTYGSGGKTFIVLPFNDPIIGVCPSTDIWYSFNNSGIGHLDGFNDNLNRVARNLGVELSQTNYNELIHQLTQIQEMLKSTPLHEHDNTLLFKIFDPNHSIVENLSNILNPDQNGFEALPLSQMMHFTNREIWFNGPAYYVTYAFKHELTEYLQEKLA